MESARSPGAQRGALAGDGGALADGAALGALGAGAEGLGCGAISGACGASLGLALAVGAEPPMSNGRGASYSGGGPSGNERGAGALALHADTSAAVRSRGRIGVR